jgi:putative ABC transport system permease protein
MPMGILSLFRNLFRKRAVEQALDDELRSSVELLAQEKMKQGLSQSVARREALIELGGIEQVKEEVRAVRAGRILEDFAKDVRFGFRTLAKSPGFTIVVVLTLALGIGATAAIFSVVYGVLLRPLPYPNPQQLVSISEVASDGHLMGFTDANFRDLRAMNRTLQGMAVYWGGPATVSSGSNAARLMVAVVSADFFRVLDVAPILGRGFSADELREGGTPAALVSYGYWREHMGSSQDFSAFKLTAEAHTFSVVGVLPPEFDYPAHTDLWVPDQMFGKQSSSRTAHNWGAAIARLREGDSVAEARANLSILARRLHQQYKPEIDMTNVSVTPLRSALTAKVRPALLILLATVGFLLLVACANVANLLLARAAARKRELAVRAALGAGRGRLVRQFLTESLLLSLSGGALGALLALWGVDALLALAPPGLARIEGVTVNVPVLGFALGISLLVAVSLGTLTALRATATGPQAALAEGTRGAAGSVASRKLARALIGGQVAVSLILLAGAGLLGHSLLQVLAVNPGFRTSNIVSMEIEVPHPAIATNWSDFAALASDTRPAQFMETLFSRLRGLPGMEQAGGVDSLPLGEGGPCSDGKFLLLDKQPHINPANPADEAKLDRLWSTTPGGEADYCVASGGYFKALGIALIRGRLFNDGDTANSQPVAIVSRSVAVATWPNQDPLGHTIEYGNMDGDLRLLTVVGVVGDVHERSLEKPADHTVYVDYRQRLRGGRDFTVVMRSATPPSILIADARRVVHAIAPGVAPRFETFRAVFSASLATRRFNLTLVGIFAASALLLAAAGIFGVMAYWVSQRTNEIGVRMALGARKRDVLKMIIGEGTKLALIGVAVGVAGALALTRFLSSLLFGVKPTDPVTFVAVSLILTAVALLASYFPARRAAKVDPMVALRHE